MKNEFLIICNIILFILFFSIIFFYLRQLKKYKSTLKSLETSQLQLKNLQTLYDDIRGFKHDFFNIMQAIDGYIKTNNPIALKKYYDELKIECDFVNNLSAIDNNIIDEPAMYNLINEKYNRAKTENVLLDMRFLVKSSKINSSPYAICKILGILLDNAIEAAKDSNEKKIILEIMPILVPNSSKRNVNITIENSYSNKDVDISRISEKGFTSKSDDSRLAWAWIMECRKHIKKA